MLGCPSLFSLPIVTQFELKSFISSSAPEMNNLMDLQKLLIFQMKLTLFECHVLWLVIRATVIDAPKHKT